MSEARIAHFRHRYQADMARGFLDDAGIPCRLLSDDAAGGVAYIGGLAGAWVIVAEENADAAVEVLGSAGMQLGPEEPSGPAAELARRADTLPPVARSDLDDLTHALEKAHKSELRHFLGCLLGATPAAIIPLVGLAARGEMALIALLTVLIVLSEGRKAVKASREVKRLEAALVQLDDDTRDE
ncbi:MAG TPA: DUF2007 domain-containing protein [Longimicrobiales bacterium]|nr:DUF2007 domain-containing protein [Longimicrobiales bacterium]